MLDAAWETSVLTARCVVVEAGGVPLNCLLVDLQAERTLLYTVGFRLHFDHPHFQIERLASDYQLERHYRAKAGFTLSQVSTWPPVFLSSAGTVFVYCSSIA